MSENPIRPFLPDRPMSAGPAVVMVQSDSRRLVVILFSVALVLGAGIGILGFLAGRRSEVGKIHPPDFAAFPPVQAAKPPPPPLQIVPLPEGSLVRDEPPLTTPGSPAVIGFDGGQPISIDGNGSTDGFGTTLEEKPAIVIRRHESKRGWVLSARTPRAPAASPAPIPAEPVPAPLAPSAAPAPTPSEPAPAPPPPVASAPPPGGESSLGAALDSSVEPPPPPP